MEEWSLMEASFFVEKYRVIHFNDSAGVAYF